MEEPEALWLDALKKAPMESRVLHNVAAVYQERGQWEKAVEEYEKALSLNNYPRKGEEAGTYFNLGNLHRDLKHPARAEYFYQKAVQVDPNCYPALNSLAVLYESVGNKDGTSLMIVTHAPEIAGRMQRMLVLQDGRLAPG